MRETNRGVATRPATRTPDGKPDRPALDLVASLAPKPWADNAGNGAHVHFSLWEGERNRFFAEDGLSELARAFLAGVLEHLPALCGLTAPSFQSYQRIALDKHRPGDELRLPALAPWGYHAITSDSIGDLRAVITANDVQAQVDSGCEAR